MSKKQTKIGTIVSQDIIQLSTQLSRLGFDFIFIDLEHGQVSDNTIAAIINSKRKETQVFIRLQRITEADIKHALDLGCDGIIAPRVETTDDLQTLVDYSYYPPLGKRSVGFGLANTFGADFATYMKQFNPIILAQVESVDGLEIVSTICSNEYVNGVFMGPYDLSMSMGIAGDFDNPAYQESIQYIQSHCQEHQKLFGTFSVDETGALKEIKKGVDLIAVGVDSNLLIRSYQKILQNTKEQS